MQTTANLWEVLCRDLESERQTAKAEQYQEITRKFVASARQVLRADSPRLCDAIEIAGDIHQVAGQLQEAAVNFKDALGKSQQFGLVPVTARLAAKLALLLDRLEESGEARRYYVLALSLYEEGHDHSQHAMLLNQLGALCKGDGDMAAAEKYYRYAMEIAGTLHGDNHPEMANAANNLGVAYIETRDFVKAENLHIQALAIREKCYGAMHPEVAQSMANLAVVYHAIGNDQKARAFYAGALKTYKYFRSAGDPEVQSVQANYDALLLAAEKSGS
ncbi:MAG: tetratricopeptide repeat protein [Verrucomicrobiota bacterium]